MMRDFENDRFYMVRYYAKCVIAFSLIIGALLFLKPWDFHGRTLLWMLALTPLLLNTVIGLVLSGVLSVALLLRFESADLHYGSLFLIALGIYFGMVAVQLIHNCAHGSFKPKFLNRWLGEIFAIHLLSGFPGFTVLHLHHHRHPDDPVLDPHPNSEGNFVAYFMAVKGKLRGHFRRIFFARWGGYPDANRIWAASQVLLPLNRVLRAWILLLVAGPVGFVLFIIPSLIANHITFAHINYFTHVRQPSGDFEIVNLDQGAFMKVRNWFMLGGYSHRNHHEAPWMFNPTHFKSKSRS